MIPPAPQPRVLVAPDKFRGIATALEAARWRIFARVMAVATCTHPIAASTVGAGGGAGGGIGWSLRSVVNARRASGADTILDLIGFDSAAQDAGLVLTGEGVLDMTSMDGKAPGAVARRAKRHRLPVIAVTGEWTPDPDNAAWPLRQTCSGKQDAT